MSELAKTLLNLRSLRAFSQDLTFDQLTEIQVKLTTVVEERQLQELENEEANEKREAQLKAVADMLKRDGIALDDLVAALAKQPKGAQKGKRAPRPAKYRYTDESGAEKTWTGQGRTPSGLVDKNLEEYLI